MSALKDYDAGSGASVADADVAPSPTPAPAPATNLTISRAAIIPAKFNARKRFSQAALTELAESIRSMGVLQPILVRLLPASRVEETATLSPRPAYEIVAGERRWRAAGLANLADMPVVVRELSDEEAAKLQLLENIQREDLNELEEAEGFQHWMEISGKDRKACATEFHRSLSQIHARLKLLDLGTEGRQALLDGKIDASKALLLARIPDGKLQIQALKGILDGGYHSDEPLSYREALEYIQEDFMLQLDSARFTITDATLLAGVGSCKDCTKRTGHAPDLFSDVKGADVCTDPPCFHRKEQAHDEQVRKAAKASGQQVILGKEAAELRQNGYNKSNFIGYKRLDSTEDSPTNQPLRKVIGDAMTAANIKPTKIQGKNGELEDCLPNDVANRLLTKVREAATTGQTNTKEAKELVKKKAADAKERLEKKFEQAWRDSLLQATWQAIKEKSLNITTEILRDLCATRARGLTADAARTVGGLLGLDKVGTGHHLLDHIKKAPNPGQLIMLMLAADDVNVMTPYGSKNDNADLLMVAGEVFPDLPAKIKLLKDDVRAELEPPKPPTATAPLAQPKKAAAAANAKNAKGPAGAAAKTPKLSAKDAQLGIAAAMQGMEAAAPAAAGTIPGGAVAPQGNEAPAAREAGQHDGLAGPLFTVGQRVIVRSLALRPEVKQFAGRGGDVVEVTGTSKELWDVTVQFIGLFSKPIAVRFEPSELMDTSEAGKVAWPFPKAGI